MVETVDIATYIEALGYQNVQQYVLQPTPDACIALVPYGGPQGEQRFGSEAMTHERPRLQVQVRGVPENPEEPGQRAYALWKQLSKQLVTLSSGLQYRHLRPLDLPRLLKKDELKRWIWTFNIEAYKAVDA